MSGLFDWRKTAPEPEIHDCDCGYCQVQGQLEDKVWPLLAEAEVNGRDHITDRRMLLQVKVAPIPENYEGSVMAGPHSVEWPEVDDSWVPARGLHFRELHLVEIERLGWGIRREPIAEPDSEKAVRCGVVDQGGKHVGWIMSCTPRTDYWDNDSTREYGVTS